MNSTSNRYTNYPHNTYNSYNNPYNKQLTDNSNTSTKDIETEIKVPYNGVWCMVNGKPKIINRKTN